MASYTVNRSKHATLVAATVDTVTVPNTASVEVFNRSASDDIYFTTNGDAPVVGADDTYIAAAGQSVIVPDAEVVGTAVKLISSGAAAYTVTVV